MGELAFRTISGVAEWFVDLYFGMAATQGTTVETTFPVGLRRLGTSTC